MCTRIDAFELCAYRQKNVNNFLDNNTYKPRGTDRVQLKKACLLANLRKKNMVQFGRIIRHSTLQTASLDAKIEGMGRRRAMWMGNMTVWSKCGYMEASRKEKDRNYWRQVIASDPALDGT